MNNKKIIFSVIIAILIVVLIITGSNNKSQLTKIRVSDQRAIGGALFHIALEKGYFEKHNIKVEVVNVQTGDEAIRAVVSNSADIALGGIVPYSFLALDDQSIKIFAVNCYVGDNQIIANKKSGISKAEDLRGKKIGYTKTTASDIGINQFLEVNNISVNDVQLVNMKPLAMAGALESGQIDAYSIWEPHIYNGQKLLGENAFVFDGEKSIYTWHQALMSKDSYIKEHGADLENFVKAMKDAEEYAKTNKDDAIKLASKYNNLSTDVLEKIWHFYDFSISLRDDIYPVIKADLEWANTQREKPNTNIPLAENLVDTSVFENVRK